jgi:pyruvate/2-oxoglutarate dehydrogenase complex dihydrolipoamide acyltransferase (E2) component
MITKNVELLPKRRLSAWRKISIGSWRPNGDSQVYAEIRVNAGPALKRIAELNQTTSQKITMTHFMGRVMGRVLSEVPDLNAIVRFGNIYPRKNVDVFFHVVFDETELSGHVVRNIDRKTCTDIAAELSSTVSQIRSGEDASFKKIKNSWRFIPGWLSRYVLDAIGFLSYSLNVNIRGSGVPKDCFGSMMITNIGSLGFSQAFVPLSPYSRIPLILALGKIESRAVVSADGTIGVEEQVGLCFTFDHRIMDGARGAKMAQLIQKYMLSPELLDE